MTQEKNAEQRDDWLGSDQMRLLAERLQPQQWLGPASMAWVWITFLGPALITMLTVVLDGVG